MLVYRISRQGYHAPGGQLLERLAVMGECWCREYGIKIEIGGEGEHTLVVRSQSEVPDEEFYFRFSLDEDCVYIANLQVPASLRRRGLGTGCIRWLQTVAGEFGLGDIMLKSYPEAMGFWEKLGFIHVVQLEEF